MWPIGSGPAMHTRRCSPRCGRQLASPCAGSAAPAPSIYLRLTALSQEQEPQPVRLWSANANAQPMGLCSALQGTPFNCIDPTAGAGTERHVKAAVFGSEPRFDGVVRPN